mgnify:CR=1 FL=1
MTHFLKYDVSEPAYLPLTAWAEHGPFAMWLVQAFKPRNIVELGTHFGLSYFSTELYLTSKSENFSTFFQ